MEPAGNVNVARPIDRDSDGRIQASRSRGAVEVASDGATGEGRDVSGGIDDAEDADARAAALENVPLEQARYSEVLRSARNLEQAISDQESAAWARIARARDIRIRTTEILAHQAQGAPPGRFYRVSFSLEPDELAAMVGVVVVQP